jgi:hypothetical protein
MKRSNFALRLQPSLLAEARKVAEAEGVALNQLNNVALAEKLSVLRTEAILPNGRRAPASPKRSASTTERVSDSRPSKATNYLMRYRRDAHLREADIFDTRQTAKRDLDLAAGRLRERMAKMRRARGSLKACGMRWKTPRPKRKI